MRIVSLCPSLTELVVDLGRGADLVGRTKFCVHPADRVASVEKVGGTKNPKVDRIIALAPDLVLMNEEENRIEDAESLRGAGIRVHASMPCTAEETADMVRSIASAIEAPAAGESIASEIEREAARVRELARARPLISFAYLIWREPWMSASGNTFVSGLLTLAGGRNVFGDAKARYPEITPQELGARNPNRVLLSSEPFPFAEKHADELAVLSGLSRDRFLLVDGELLSWHGSRTPRGIAYAATVMSR